MKNSFFSITLFATCLSLFCNASNLELDPNRLNQLEVQPIPENGYNLKTTGKDPNFVLTVTSAEALSDGRHVLAFDYFCPDGVDFIEVFYAKGHSKQWSEAKKINGGRLPKAEAWQPFSIDLEYLSDGDWDANHHSYRIDLGRRPGVDIQITNFHLREPNTVEKQSKEEAEAILQAKYDRANQLNRYLEAEDVPAQVESVSVGPDTITIKGVTRTIEDATYNLVEYEPHQNPWNRESGAILTELDRGHRFERTLPRYIDGRDRIAHRFGIVTTVKGRNTLVSHAVWPTDLSGAAERDMPRLRPTNKKGLGDISYKAGIFDQDLDALGITATTVNIPLGHLLDAGTNPVIRFEHQGKTWELNRRIVEKFDKKMKLLTDRGIVTSAILLVDLKAEALIHPEYNTTGIYSMANLTTREATDTYRAVVAFLAERYSRPDQKYGWITHWIVFNEIDYGWIWTNMGEQPMPLYVDAYEKAMRLTYIEARRFNPTAEVFASLTHHWNKSPANPLHAYPARSVIDRLGLYSQKTGNYHWGIGYHPYPESLRQARTWEDEVTIAFDTNYITPKNIEVLDAYIRQPHFLYQGQPRTILLSEQGFNTPDYSESAMINKAAAIAYTWEKILPLDTVESFHYHRWVDHPNEGGLRLGLRTFPEPGKPYGERKEPAFSLFSALETEEHAHAIEPFKTVIGIDDWSELHPHRQKTDQ